MELKDFLTIATLLTLLCPGLIFVFIYTVVTFGRSPEVNKDNLTAYVAVSAVYTVSASSAGLIPSALLSKEFSLTQASLFERFQILAFALIVPAFLGLVYSAIKQKKIIYKGAKRLGLDPMYPAPTAWETSIERIIQGDYVIATLKDGRIVAGNIDHLANFSSKEDCYDMLISETDPPDDQASDVTRATWIASGEVSTLEIVSRRPTVEQGPRLFFRHLPEGESYGRKGTILSTPNEAQDGW